MAVWESDAILTLSKAVLNRGHSGSVCWKVVDDRIGNDYNAHKINNDNDGDKYGRTVLQKVGG